MPSARRIIGRSINKTVSDALLMLRDEVLFKDPPPKEDCPICFLPMPKRLIYCLSLPPATISSVPIYDFAIANNGVEDKAMERYYPCCGKHICGGCFHSFCAAGNVEKCPFCNSDRVSKTDEEDVADLMKRVEVNDSGAMCQLGNCYYKGLNGVQQDRTKAMELWKQAAKLGSSDANCHLGGHYHEGGNMKKAKFHVEAAAMAGHEEARYNLKILEYNSGNVEQALKHWTIAASAGECYAMHELRESFEEGYVSRESINSTLAAYNSSCAEMGSEARDAFISNLSSLIEMRIN